MKQQKLTAIDLFCGVGGTTLGLKNAGFSVIGSVDLDKDALNGYRMNHPEVKVWEEDITNLNPKSVMNALKIKKGELDLLAGCPPCQGFSRIRARSSLEQTKDKRNDLVFEFLRYTKAFLPKTIMMENVPGLKVDPRMEYIKKELIKLGYHIEFSIKNAEDYGVPQRRKRFILIGSLVGPVCLAEPKKQKKTVRQAIGFLSKAGFSGDPLHDVIPNYKPEILKIFKMIPKDGGLRSDLPQKYQLQCHQKSRGFRDVYGRMKWDDVSPTITGGCTAASKGRFIHPHENRAITLREASLLQGFPVNYKFPTNISRGKIALLIGNAFPPAFTTSHAKLLVKSLKDD